MLFCTKRLHSKCILNSCNLASLSYQENSCILSFLLKCTQANCTESSQKCDQKRYTYTQSQKCWHTNGFLLLQLLPLTLDFSYFFTYQMQVARINYQLCIPIFQKNDIKHQLTFFNKNCRKLFNKPITGFCISLQIDQSWKV